MVASRSAVPGAPRSIVKEVPVALLLNPQVGNRDVATCNRLIQWET